MCGFKAFFGGTIIFPQQTHNLLNVCMLDFVAKHRMNHVIGRSFAGLMAMEGEEMHESIQIWHMG